MRKTLTFITLILIASTCFGQRIKGEFKIAGEPARYETIWLLSANGDRLGTAMTDSSGRFEIPVQPGEYSIVSFDSRNQPQAETKAKVGEGQTVRILLFTSEVEEVQIISRSPIELDNSIVQTILTAEDIKQSGYRSVGEFATAIPGVYVEDGGAIYFRGSRPGGGLFLVDNMKIRGNLEVCKASYSSIAFISGGIPAEYGDFTGGMIKVNTHNPGHRGWVDDSDWYEATYAIYGTREPTIAWPLGKPWVMHKKLPVSEMQFPDNMGVVKAGEPIPWDGKSPTIIRSFKSEGHKYHVIKI